MFTIRYAVVDERGAVICEEPSWVAAVSVADHLRRSTRAFVFVRPAKAA